MFADFDPEDAYDADDAVDVRLDVLERVVDNLRSSRDDRFDVRRRDLLRVVGNLVDADLTRRENRRLRKIRDDIEELG